MEIKSLNRFLIAQEKNYHDALEEIIKGRKVTHWMWYVFPQIAGLGTSEMAKFYALENLKEAHEYFTHPILGKRLIEISTALLMHTDKSAYEILGSPDDMKLHSSMTLFTKVEQADPVFGHILSHFYNNSLDSGTLKLLSGQKTIIRQS